MTTKLTAWPLLFSVNLVSVWIVGSSVSLKHNASGCLHVCHIDLHRRENTAICQNVRKISTDEFWPYSGPAWYVHKYSSNYYKRSIAVTIKTYVILYHSTNKPLQERWAGCNPIWPAKIAMALDQVIIANSMLLSAKPYSEHGLNTLRPGQNGRHFANGTFKCIFLNENCGVLDKVPFKYVPGVPLTITKSTLLKVSIGAEEATSHYPKQCWPCSIELYGVAMPQCTGIRSWWRHQMETFSAFTGHLCGEFTGQRWIPYTKASDAELWCFLWSAPE